MKVGIKWPNDVLADGRKLVGILTEMSAEMESIHYVIIDTGIKNEDAAFIWTRCGLLVLLAAIGLASSLTAQWFSA